MLNDMQINDADDAFAGMHKTVIKVVGCGGCGGNAVDLMIDSNVENVEFIALNTDLQALTSSKAPIRLGIGAKITAGLGAGGDPTKGEQAAEEDKDKIVNCIKGADMVFVTAGMGGGTGTGSAPVVAKCAKEQGALTVAVVTTPLNFEGTYKMSIAQEGIKKLRNAVDALIVVPNQAALTALDKKVSFIAAFNEVNQILRMGVQGISDIITKKGVVNTDFADVKAAISNQGDVLFGIGTGKGTNRAIEAASAAINNKLLEDSHIDGAKNIILNVFGSENVSLAEVDEIMVLVRESAAPDARIYWGQVVDSSMEDNISITLIAAGFNHDDKKPVAPVQTKPIAKAKSTKDDITYGDFEVAMGKKLTKSTEQIPTENSTSTKEESSTETASDIDVDDLNVPAFIRKNTQQFPTEIKFN